MQNSVGGEGGWGWRQADGEGAALAEVLRQIAPGVLQGRREKANRQEEQDLSCTQSQTSRL